MTTSPQNARVRGLFTTCLQKAAVQESGKAICIHTAYHTSVALFPRLFAQIVDSGRHKPFEYLVFELLGPPLASVIWGSTYTPLPRKQVLEIMKQLVAAVACKYFGLVSSIRFQHSDLGL